MEAVSKGIEGLEKLDPFYSIDPLFQQPNEFLNPSNDDPLNDMKDMKVQAMNGKSKKLANMFQTHLTCLKIRFIPPCAHVNICVKKDQNNK